MTTVKSGEKYEHENIGKVEVQEIIIRAEDITLNENQDVKNSTELVQNGKKFVRLYSYVSGMPATQELSEFISKSKPYQDES